MQPTERTDAPPPRLKILVYGLNFAPELTGVGRYTADMAKFLHEQGHEVRVVTAYPYYPDWWVAPGYRPWRYAREVWEDIPVLRCPLWVPRRPSTSKRLVHLVSFALASFAPLQAEALRLRPDVVWTVEPTTFGAPAALLAARISGARAWLHVQDIELVAAASLGMVTGPTHRIVQTLYAWLLRGFDRVSTISDTMRRELARFSSLPADTVELVRNWVDTDRIYPLEGDNPLKRELGLDDGRIVCLYSGNMGEKHGVESLAEAARLLRNRLDVHFVLCGAGAARDRVAALTADLPNVTLLPLQPEERLNELLNLADMHLLPQRGETTGYAMPSKVGAMLASGRAIVAQAGPESELARDLADCALLVPPGDAAATAEAILDLAEDGDKRRLLAKGVRARAVATLSRVGVLSRLTWLQADQRPRHEPLTLLGGKT